MSTHRNLRRSTARLLIAITTGTITLACSQAFAQVSTTWIRAGDGDWNDPTAWSNGVPTFDHYAFLPDVGVPYIVTAGGATPDSVEGLSILSHSATLRIPSGTFSLSAIGPLVNNGTIDYSGATFSCSLWNHKFDELGNVRGPTGTMRLSGGSSQAGLTIDAANLGNLQLKSADGATITNTGSGTVNLIDAGLLKNMIVDTDISTRSVTGDLPFVILQGNSTINFGRTLHLTDMNSNQAQLDVRIDGAAGVFGEGQIVTDSTNGSAVRISGLGAASLLIGSGVTFATGTASCFTALDPSTLINQGTVVGRDGKSMGFSSVVDVQNNGTFVAENGGQLSANDLLNLSGGVLSGGKFIVRGANSRMSFGGTITTNAADIRIDGASASFNTLASLTTNTGTFALANSQAFRTAGAFANSGTVAMSSDGALLVNGALTNTGTIDLSGRLLVDYDGATPLPALVQQLQTGRNGGAWDGPGINSSAAAASSITGVGMIESAQWSAANGGTSTFAGYILDGTEVVARYTLNGDTELNGTVNFDDYARVDSGFNNNRTGWFNGDFDYNGVVDFDDYALIDLAFNARGLTSTIPETIATSTISGLAALAAGRRRRFTPNVR